MENKHVSPKDIKGWGVDADPRNEPTYPMKHYTGDDHKHPDYERADQQQESVELLQSIERPTPSAVFGTSVPPSGLSGVIRRFAFRFSESEYGHWLPLLLADRINMGEGVLDDLRHGHIPNLVKEWGLKSEWQYNRKGLAKKMGVTVLLSAAVVVFFAWRNQRKK